MVVSVRLRVGLALFVFFEDCATPMYWAHPVTMANFQRDSYECERDMRQSLYFGTGIVGRINAEQFQERCMQARGYYKVSAVPAPPADPQKLAVPTETPNKSPSAECLELQKKLNLTLPPC